MRILLLVSVCTVLVAESTPSQVLGAKLHEFVKAEHPEATCTFDGDRFTIAVATRSFPIMRPDKTGAWQEPKEETGPDRGGLLLHGYIDSEQGWGGAQMVRDGHLNRFDTDFHVFHERVIIWPGKKKASHLWLSIKTPRIDKDADFAKKVERTALNFYSHWAGEKLKIGQPNDRQRLRLHEIELYCADPDASRDFFRDTIGLPMNFEKGELKIFTLKPQFIDLDLSQHNKEQLRISFLVEDLDAYIAELKERKIEVGEPKMVHLGMREVQFTDPDGNQIAVHELTEKTNPHVRKALTGK